MKITLVGMGCGLAGLTGEGLAALRQADLILGAGRLLETLSGLPARKVAAVQNDAIVAALEAGGYQNACVAFSGDTGFYSGAARLLAALEERGLSAKILPGVSSLQYFAARLGRPWQDWLLVSAHGRACDPVAQVMQGKPVFFLTGGRQGVAGLCRALTEAGLGGLEVTVGENLSYPEETITTTTAAALAESGAAPLSVLLVQPAPRCPRRAPGIPDEAFIRGKTPMTKQEVRAAILAKLAPGPEEICWDVGAGTGSVSVELALCAGKVFAVEREEEACALVRANREKFCAWNFSLTVGAAPAALEPLPAPDVVFVGGSGGELPTILDAIRRKNPQARVCVSAIALETLHSAMEQLAALGWAVEVSQISVSRAKGVGSLHLLMAQNPVFLITGTPV